MERLLFNRSGLRRLLALKGAGAGGTLTENTVTGNPATFTTNVARALSGFTVPFTPIQAGSGDPSPDNVRPISGITGLAIMQNSVNAVETASFTDGYYLNDSGTPTSTVSAFRYTDNYIPVTPGTVMRYYAVTNAAGKVRVHEYDTDKTWLRQTVSASTTNGAYDESFTVSADAAYIRYSAPTTVTNEYLGVDFGVDWTSEGTVYGGELDVKTGVLTVSWYGVSYDGTESGWNWYATYKQAFIALPYQSKYDNATGVFWTSNLLLPTSYDGRRTNVGNFASLGSNGNNAAFSAPDCDTLEAFIAFISANPLQFVYTLNTPMTIQLDPVAVQTLVGSNTIWTDTNGTNTIKYLTRQ